MKSDFEDLLRCKESEPVAKDFISFDEERVVLAVAEKQRR